MNFIQQQANKIAKSFNTDPVLDELRKMEILEIEKGGRRAQIGEKRMFGGREYIKTPDGWKFHGKGTGAKAQEHAKTAGSHGKVEASEGKDTYGSDMSDAELKERLDYHQTKEREAKKRGDNYKDHSKVRALESEWSKRNKLKLNESTKNNSGKKSEKDQRLSLIEKLIKQGFSAEDAKKQVDGDNVNNSGKKEFSKQSIAKLIEGENNWNLHVDSQKESHGKQRIIIRDNNAPVVKTGWDEGNRPVRFIITQNKDGSYELTTSHATGQTETFKSESLDEIKQVVDEKNRGYNQRRNDVQKAYDILGVDSFIKGE